MKKTIKGTAVIVSLCCALTVSVGQTAAAGHWADSYAAALTQKSAGFYTDILATPDATVTPEEFTLMILRISGLAPTEAATVETAIAKGLLLEAETVLKDAPLSRAFAAQIGHRALTAIIGETDVADVLAAERLSDLYADRSAAPGVAQLYTKGILTGRPDGAFHPGDTLTKAESAVIIARLFDASLRAPKPTAPQSVEGAIAPDAALALLAEDETAWLVDVRSAEEYAAGHIPGGVNIPLPLIVDDIATAGIPADKDTPIILYCQKGSKSLRVYKILTEAGYTRVYNAGGIESWPYETVTAS